MKDGMTMTKVSIEIRNESKIAAAVKRITLQEYVEDTLRAENKKTMEKKK